MLFSITQSSLSPASDQKLGIRPGYEAKIKDIWYVCLEQPFQHEVPSLFPTPGTS